MKAGVGITAALFLAMLPVLATATESGSVRCSGGIVSVGDTAGEVIAKCGEPSYRTQRQKIVETRDRRDKITTTVTIDDWTFNFGRNQFQYQVLIEDGRVVRIESLDYGY